MTYERIDRVDERGDIREHFISPKAEDRTLCGLSLPPIQPPLGNGLCKRCRVLAGK